VDISGDPNNPDLNIAWKFVWTAKDSWLGPSQSLGSVPALYNLTMDPFERYDMIFNGAEGEMNGLRTSAGRYAGEDNGWAGALTAIVLADFDKSIMKYPSIQRSPGGASNDMIPDLQHPKNPLPLLDPNNMPKAAPSSD
jgi:arylsulfatase